MIHKLYRWKRYMWVVFDPERKGNRTKNQDPWFPVFYPLLEQFPKHDVLHVSFCLPDDPAGHLYRFMATGDSHAFRLNDGTTIHVPPRDLQAIFGTQPAAFAMDIAEVRTVFTEDDFTTVDATPDARGLILRDRPDTALDIAFDMAGGHSLVLRIRGAQVPIGRFQDCPSAGTAIGALNRFLVHHPAEAIAISLCNRNLGPENYEDD
jgi:hypothetical protein